MTDEQFYKVQVGDMLRNYEGECWIVHEVATDKSGFPILTLVRTMQASNPLEWRKISLRRG